MENSCSIVGGSTPMLRAAAVNEVPRASSVHICISWRSYQVLPSVRAATVNASLIVRPAEMAEASEPDSRASTMPSRMRPTMGRRSLCWSHHSRPRSLPSQRFQPTVPPTASARP